MKCFRNTPAEALVDEHENEGVGALVSIRAQYQGEPQKGARRQHLEATLPGIIFRGDGTDDITDYIENFTGTFTKLYKSDRYYTDDEEVDKLLKGIKCTKQYVVTVRVNARN